MSCFTDCSVLNLTTCTFIDHRQGSNPATSVSYDANGCYDTKEYMEVFNTGYKFEAFSNVIGWFMLLFGCFGLIGNSLSIFVLLKKEKICFNYLLAALNMFDTIHLFFAILDVIRNNYEDYYPDLLLLVFPYFHYPLYRLTLCCSIFMIVSITVERFLALTKPHHRLTSNSKRAAGYIFPCFLIAVLLNVTKFVETETVEFCLDFTMCERDCGFHSRLYVRPTALRLSPDYILFYTTWTWTSLTSILPILVLASLNLVIWRKLQQAKEVTRRLNRREGQQRQNKEEKTHLSSTAILLCTVTMFIICHSPRLILGVYEAWTIKSILKCQSQNMGFTPIWYLYSMASVQLLQVINQSVNFPIYWFVGNFRDTFHNIFSRKKENISRPLCETESLSIENIKKLIKENNNIINDENRKISQLTTISCNFDE